MTDDFTISALHFAKQDFLFKVQALESKRYYADRDGLRVPHHTSSMEHDLEKTRTIYPESPRYFKRMMRIAPAAFDGLVKLLDQNPIFQQLPTHSYTTSVHLSLFLWRFGRTGEITGDIVFGSGVSEGTINNMTDRVGQALADIHPQILCPASPEEKEEAKNYVFEKTKVYEWRDGLCVLNGTPFKFGIKP